MKNLLLLFIASFSLTIFAQTTILEEDFEGGSLPTDWTKSSNGQGWEFGTCGGPYWFPAPHSSKYAYVNDALDGSSGPTNDASIDYLVTPEVDLSTYSAVLMKFDIFNDGYNPNGASAIVTLEAIVGNDTTVVDTISYVSTWRIEYISLADYVGQSAVKFAIHYNDLGLWNSGMAIDDIKIYEPSPYDAGLVSINHQDFILAGDVELKGVLKNFGSVDLTSVNVNWSIDGGTTNTDTLTGLSIAPNATYEFTHSTTMNMNEKKKYALKVWVSNPNGQPDGFEPNNELQKDIITLSQLPTKKVFCEEGTGTKCGNCVRGIVALKDMEHFHPDSWIGVSIHTYDDDPMQHAEYASILYPGKLSGIPSGLIDRMNQSAEIDITEFENSYNKRVALNTPVSVEILNVNYNDTSRALSFDVVATTYSNFSADYRINAVVSQNGVSGVDGRWDQKNYAHNSYDLIDWEGNNWKDKPELIPASEMVYNHVSRKLLGGWDGTSGSIPSTVVDATPYTQSYVYTVPDSINAENFHIIGIVINQTTQEIMNSNSVSALTTSVNNISLNNNVKIYPNPTKGIVNIINAENSTIEVYNINGQLINKINNSSNIERIDLSNNIQGMYIVKIITNKEITTRKVSLLR